MAGSAEIPEDLAWLVVEGAASPYYHFSSPKDPYEPPGIALESSKEGFIETRCGQFAYRLAGGGKGKTVCPDCKAFKKAFL